MTSPVRDDTQPGMKAEGRNKPQMTNPDTEGLRATMARMKDFMHRLEPGGTITLAGMDAVECASDLRAILSDREALKARLEKAEGLLQLCVQLVPPPGAIDAAEAFLKERGDG